MDADDIRQTYWKFVSERTDLCGRRAELEAELSETRNKITHLDQVLEHLASLSGITDTSGSVSRLGLTDAIRTVVQVNRERFSPQDVKQRLQDRGYDLSDLTAPMASIYKVLSRLAENPEEQLGREKEDGRIYYKYTGVTDDENPF
jgi:uncharacterized protein YhaN